jgi:hypothetical protein
VLKLPVGKLPVFINGRDTVGEPGARSRDQVAQRYRWLLTGSHPGDTRTASITYPVDIIIHVEIHRPVIIFRPSTLPLDDSRL